MHIVERWTAAEGVSVGIMAVVQIIIEAVSNLNTNLPAVGASRWVLSAKIFY